MSEWSSGYIVDVPYTQGFTGSSRRAFCPTLPCSGPCRTGQRRSAAGLLRARLRTGRTPTSSPRRTRTSLSRERLQPGPHRRGARARRRGRPAERDFFEDSFEEFSRRGTCPLSTSSPFTAFTVGSRRRMAPSSEFIKDASARRPRLYLLQHHAGLGAVMPLRGLLSEWTAQGAATTLNRSRRPRPPEATRGGEGTLLRRQPEGGQAPRENAKGNPTYLVHEYINRNAPRSSSARSPVRERWLDCGCACPPAGKPRESAGQARRSDCGASTPFLAALGGGQDPARVDRDPPPARLSGGPKPSSPRRPGHVPSLPAGMALRAAPRRPLQQCGRRHRASTAASARSLRPSAAASRPTGLNCLAGSPGARSRTSRASSRTSCPNAGQRLLRDGKPLRRRYLAEIRRALRISTGPARRLDRLGLDTPPVA